MAFHFTRFLRPVVAYMKNVLVYHVLWYLDDFLIAPTGRRAATDVDCLKASQRLHHGVEDIGEEALGIMGRAFEPSNWTWRANHMTACALFMDKSAANSRSTRKT